MNKLAEHLAQALCSLSPMDKADVIQYVLEDPEIKEVVVKILVNRLGNSPKSRNSEIGTAFIATSNNKEMGMLRRASYISQLKQQGILISQITRVSAKTPENLWVAIPFATERRPNRWFLGLPEKEVLERIDNCGLAIILLCQQQDNILDFVLPPSKVQEIATQLSKSQGQLKFNLKKLGNSYHLVIPHHPALDLSDYKGNLSIFQKSKARIT